MPRKKDNTKHLENLIKNLQQERQTHVDAIAEIDRLFSQYGIKAEGTAKRRGRPPGSKNTGRKPGRPKGSGRKASKGRNAKFDAWADKVESWPVLAKKVGISYKTALSLRDGTRPRTKVRAKIEKASGGSVPASSWA